MSLSTVENPVRQVQIEHQAVEQSRSRGRTIIIVLLIVALALTALTRDFAIDRREAATNSGRLASNASSGSRASSLGSMPSYATALLLGGLRGPLVMILWTSSENQKQAHDLQDFDTKVEWIRLLQPEFDTVHLFQIWNKAYNISVLMADQANKYTTILDAIDYAQKVDKERPDDINILTAVAGIYGDKLGTSQEHPFFRRQVRKETQTRYRVSFPVAKADQFKTEAAKLGWSDTDSSIASNEKTGIDSVLLEAAAADALKTSFNGADVKYEVEVLHEVQHNDPAWRRLRLDPMVDIDGNILPSLLEVRYPRPSDLAADKPWYDGSQLQFLKKYGPFRYGLSTMALSYNDYKRSQLLLELWNQHHIQSGDPVVDSRPALALKLWAKDEWERGRRAELRMAGAVLPPGVDPVELEKPSAPMPLKQIGANDDINRAAALDAYQLAAQLYADSRAEYFRHIGNYRSMATTYLVHIDDTISGEQIMHADHDYLAATVATGADRDKLIDSATKYYNRAAQVYALTILKYYTGDSVVLKTFPKDPATGKQYTRVTIDRANPGLWPGLLIAANAANKKLYVDDQGVYDPRRDEYRDDHDEYMTYITRCGARLQQLQAAAGKPADAGH